MFQKSVSVFSKFSSFTGNISKTLFELLTTYHAFATRPASGVFRNYSHLQARPIRNSSDPQLISFASSSHAQLFTRSFFFPLTVGLIHNSSHLHLVTRSLLAQQLGCFATISICNSSHSQALPTRNSSDPSHSQLVPFATRPKNVHTEKYKHILQAIHHQPVVAYL